MRKRRGKREWSRAVKISDGKTRYTNAYVIRDSSSYVDNTSYLLWVTGLYEDEKRIIGIIHKMSKLPATPL